MDDKPFTNTDERVHDPVFSSRLLLDLPYLRSGESRPVGEPEPLRVEFDAAKAVLATSVWLPAGPLRAEDICIEAESLRRATHMPCFDLDFKFGTIKVIESASGKSHLYINVAMKWEDVVVLLDAFEKAGLLEPGYVKACKTQGMTRLRMPGVPKIPSKWAGYTE